MGRSVMTPCGMTACAYLDFSPAGWDDPDWPDDPSDWDWECAWDDYVDSIQWWVRKRYPSFQTVAAKDADWRDRECREILRNGHGSVYVAEYCGSVSVAFVPDDRYAVEYPSEYALACAWGRGLNLTEALRPMDPLCRLGTMSNGVAVYRRAYSTTEG